jgi:hypothetical protein
MVCGDLTVAPELGMCMIRPHGGGRCSSTRGDPDNPRVNSMVFDNTSILKLIE